MNIIKDKNIILRIAITLVVALILWFVGISTVNSKVSSNNTQKSTLQASNATLNSQIDAEKVVASNKGFIISKLTQFQQAVPQSVNLGSITNQLNALCQAANINWVGDSIGASVASPSGSTLVQTVSLNFTVSGSWNSIENTFIPGLYRAPSQPPQQVSQLMVITGYAINLGQMKGNTFVPTSTTTISFTALVYVAPTITPVAGS